MKAINGICRNWTSITIGSPVAFGTVVDHAHGLESRRYRVTPGHNVHLTWTLYNIHISRLRQLTIATTSTWGTTRNSQTIQTLTTVPVRNGSSISPRIGFRHSRGDTSRMLISHLCSSYTGWTTRIMSSFKFGARLGCPSLRSRRL